MIRTSCPKCGAKMAIERTTPTCSRCGYIALYGDYEAPESGSLRPDDEYSEYEAEEEYDDDY